MVIESNQAGIYLHAAYATDENGTDFSLTSFPGAVYIGNYMDRSSTESTDPTKYTWKPLYTDTIDPSEIEDDSEAYESVDVADVQESVEDLSGTANSLSVRTDYNEDNIEKTQSAQDEGLGNLNLLVGTNQGATGWTASNSYLTTISEAVYSEDPNDAIDTVGITVTSGADTLIFDSSALLDYIAANNEEENTYTLSYDIKVSNTGASMSVSVPGVLTFDSPEFTDEEDDDLSGTWLHFTSTATIESTSGTDLAFVYSGSANDTLQIANLKVEAGALATPWRASLEEVEGIANTALSEARAVSQHFWTDSSGAHVTEVTQAQYEADPTTAGGNTLITSSGMDVRNGTDTLASFGSTTTIGEAEGLRARTQIEPTGLKVIWRFSNNTDKAFLDGGYDLYNGPYFTFGERTGTTGAFSFSAGENNEASGEAAHAEGGQTTASGLTAHAEGGGTTASGQAAHAEGGYTTSSGMASHAEGGYTEASAQASHAEGGYTLASGVGAHAEGEGTIAAGKAQHVGGRFNIAETVATADTYGQYARIIGNGTDDNNRSNALTVDWSGNIEAGDFTGGDISGSAISGDSVAVTGSISGASASVTDSVTVGRDPTSNLEVATKQYVDSQGFSGSATSLTARRTLGSSETSYALNDSISNYKFLTFEFFNSNNYGRWTVPVSIFTLSTSAVENVVTRGGSTTRYAYIRYIDDTHVGVYCSIASGLNMYIFGIK